MTVLAIRLENFMAFADTGWLELRPISLLFGRNSSGKSAIIRALRLLRQSLDIPPDHDDLRRRRNDHLRFVAEYGLNQGDFESTIHYPVLVPNPSQFHKPKNKKENATRDDSNGGKQQEEWDLFSSESVTTTETDFRVPAPDEVRQPDDEVISFHFRCEVDEKSIDQVLIWVNQYRKNAKQESISINAENRIDQIGWLDFTLRFARSYEKDTDSEPHWLTELVGMEIQCSWPVIDEPLIILSASRSPDITEKETIEKTEMPKEWLWQPEWHIYSDVLHGHKVGEGNWEEIEIGRQIGFLPHLIIPDDIKYSQSGMLRDDINFVDTLLTEFKRIITDFLEGILYIGPIRPAPKRSYAFDQTQMEIWHKQGWGAYLDFLQNLQGGSRFVQNVGTWLKELKLGPQLRATPASLGNLGFVSAVDIFEVTNGVAFNLKDMGFGASQVLPIIVQCLAAPAGSLIIIEQPELHLHPSAQAVLGDLFIQTSQRGVRCLIETHSEYVLLRLRRRVAETSAKAIASNDIASLEIKVYQIDLQALIVVFIDRVAGVSFVALINIDDFGSLDYMPTGFRDFFSDDLSEARKLRKASREAKLGRGENHDRGN